MENVDYEKLWKELKNSLYFGHPLYSSVGSVTKNIAAEMAAMELGHKFAQR